MIAEDRYVAAAIHVFRGQARPLREWTSSLILSDRRRCRSQEYLVRYEARAACENPRTKTDGHDLTCPQSLLSLPGGEVNVHWLVECSVRVSTFISDVAKALWLNIR